MVNASLGWTQDQEIKCSKCGKTTKFKSVSFTDVCGDVRLNFVKIASSDCETCPHCGNEMDVDVSWWQRVFPYKSENGEILYLVVPLWFKDNCEGCSVDDLKKPASYASNTYDFDDLRLDFDGVKELVEHLYDLTKDSTLLPVKDMLNGKLGDESIEAVIPELTRIINSHDDVLKIPYMPKI